MTWYAAHIIMVVKFKVKPQRGYPVWENVVLIRAGSTEEAFARAEQIGRDAEGDDGGSFRWGGRPAAWEFAGVRKLCMCDGSTNDGRPGDGDEVTYLEYELGSAKAVAQLAAGGPVTARSEVTTPGDSSVAPAKRRKKRA